MLVRSDEAGVLAIGQASHAWISGQLARAWGNERFGDVAPREEVCLAAEQHDAGMAEWDLQPDRHPDTGLPVHFMQMRLATHLALWRDAPRRLLSQSAYAALLVSLHGTALYAMRDLDAMEAGDAAAVSAYLDAERSWQQQLAARLGADGDLLWRNQRLLWAWDGLSLALCLGWQPYAAEGVPAAAGSADVALRRRPDGSFTLDPWPLSTDRLEVRCEGRRLRGRFAGERELHAALAAAPLETVRFELRPADRRL